MSFRQGDLRYGPMGLGSWRNASWLCVFRSGAGREGRAAQRGDHWREQRQSKRTLVP